MMRRGGFTLTELSVALALIALALAVLSPLLVRGTGSARRSTCMSNLRNLGLAIQMYSYDHDGFFPPASTGLRGIDEYVRNRDTYRCPAASYHVSVDEGFIIDYVYRPGFSNESLAGEPVAADSRARHQGGANVVTADASAHWYPASRWRTFFADVEGSEER